MDRAAFWDTIERSTALAADDEERAAALEAALRAQPAHMLQEFAEEQARLMRESHSWLLWGAAYVINGGCSDDGFDYFRGWLLLRGREVWERALADPDSLADVPATRGDVECEDVLYAVGKAYREVTGSDLGFATATVEAEPAGQEWDEDDLPRLLPRLWARFGPAAVDADLADDPEAETAAQLEMHRGIGALQRQDFRDAARLFMSAREHGRRPITRLLAANNIAWSLLHLSDSYAEGLRWAETATRELDAVDNDRIAPYVQGTSALAYVMNGLDAGGVTLAEALLEDETAAVASRASRLCIAAIGRAHLGDIQAAQRAIDEARSLDPSCSLLPAAIAAAGLS